MLQKKYNGYTSIQDTLSRNKHNPVIMAYCQYENSKFAYLTQGSNNKMNYAKDIRDANRFFLLHLISNKDSEHAEKQEHSTSTISTCTNRKAK